MKISAKTKDYHLLVKIKASFRERFDENALKAFARSNLRGFLKPQEIKKNAVEYSGPIGISLYERLKKPITKRDFLFIMEQIVAAAQKIGGSGLRMEHVIWDLNSAFINDTTKEMQLIYAPMEGSSNSADVVAFMESIIYSATPAAEKDTEYISRFVYFLKGQKSFSPDALEQHIEKEDRSVVNTIKKQNAGQSGFITNKRKEYYDHYSDGEKKQDAGADSDATKLLSDDANESRRDTGNAGQGTAYGNYASAGSSRSGTAQQDYDATGLLTENSLGGQANMGSSGADAFYGNYAGASGGNASYGNYEATGLLTETSFGGQTGAGSSGANASYGNYTDAFRSNASYGGYQEAVGMRGGYTDDDGGTALLNDHSIVHFPRLLRVMTQENISINKPVFRLGKERSYVDYFVTNNNAVSRSHADIVTRGNNYFVIDLNSKNHTYINGQILPVQCEIEIRNGDRLKLGNEEFVFYV